MDLIYNSPVISTNVFTAEDLGRENDKRGADLTSNYLS